MAYFRTSFLLIVLMFVAAFGAAQSKKEKIKTYYDKDWKEIRGKKDATFFRTVEKADSGVIVRDYHTSGTLQMFAECASDETPLVYHGKVKWYYETGTLKREANYQSKKEVGQSTTYYPSGKPHVEKFTEGDKTRYLHCWTEDGQDLLSDGSAIIPGDYPDTFKEIKDFIVFASFQVGSNSDTTYLICEVLPVPVHGMEGVYKQISREIHYPASARQKGIQGTVFVGFTVGKTGALTDIKVVKSIQKECDDEAARVVALIPWKPGMHNGKPVAVKYVLPVKYKMKR